MYLSLDLIVNLPSSITQLVAEHVIHGVRLILHQNIVKYGSLSHQRITVTLFSRTHTEWNLITGALRSTVFHPEAARFTLDLIVDIVSERQGYRLPPDSFTCLVAVLDDFATAAPASGPAQSSRTKRAQPRPVTE